MPLSPQITITPEDITYKSFDITAVSYTSSTATYTATGHTLSAGNIVMITGIAPDGYNGTYTISSVATNTFTVANTTNTALTDQTGNVYWADPTEYEYTGGQTVSYLPNDNDVSSLINTNATVAAAVATANSAASAAATAQSDATTALANAATAYTTAQNSLQPSAYAIQNPTTKQLTAIDATGLTVYSGGSSTSGARVVLNSVGLAGYNSSGTATFSVSASTGDAVFKGNIAGASIVGSDLNISGNCIIKPTGELIALSATIKGEIRGESGYFGTSTNGFSISSTGLVGVGSGTIVGGTISTSSANNRIIMGSSSNSLSFYYSGSPVAHMVATTGGAGVWLHYGTSANGSTRSYPLVGMSSSDASLEGSSTYQIVSSSTGNVIYGAASFTSTISSTGSITANGELYAAGHTTTANAANGYVFTTGGRIARSTASSQRYKENIVDLKDVPELDPRKLLDFRVRAFSYKQDYLQNDDRTGVLIPGLIAEEVDAIYPLAVDYLDGQIENINDRAILINLLALVQYQEARIKALEGK